MTMPAATAPAPRAPTRSPTVTPPSPGSPPDHPTPATGIARSLALSTALPGKPDGHDRPGGAGGELPSELGLPRPTDKSDGEGSTTAKLQLAAGRKLGTLELTGPLGRGGMGTVWEAVDTSLHRRVAVKFLTEAKDDARRRFLREARLAAGLSHPHIVTVHQVAEEAGVPYIVTELMEGGSLDQIVGGMGPMAPAAAAKLLLQAASALEHAHARRVVHRDIKPGNMLLTADGVLKVADFGLARSLGDASDLTTPGTVVGTPQYLAPELCTGGEPGPATDLYALGCTGWFLLTGKKPFAGGDAWQVMLKHVHEPLPDLTKLRPDVPAALVRIINRVCAKSPEERHRSAAELAADLDRYLAGGERSAGGTLHVDGAEIASREGGTSVLTIGGAADDAGRRAGGDAGGADVGGGEPPTVDLETDSPQAGSPLGPVGVGGTSGGGAAGGNGRTVVAAGAGTAMHGISPLSVESLGSGAGSRRPDPLVRLAATAAGAVAVAIGVWFCGAVFRAWQPDGVWVDGLHPFAKEHVGNGQVLAYLFWMGWLALAAGPIINTLHARHGAPGATLGVLAALDAALASSLLFWGPVAGLVLLVIAAVPGLILMAVQARDDNGFSVPGMTLLAGVGAVLTAVAVPGAPVPVMPWLGGVLDVNKAEWWQYITFAVVPALVTFLPALLGAVFQVSVLRDGRFAIGLGLCLTTGMYIWGPAGGVMLSMTALTAIGGLLTALDIT